MKPWLKKSLWVLFALLVVALLWQAQRVQKNKVVESPSIIIHVNGENAFLNEDELLTRIKRKGLIYNGQAYEDLKPGQIERYIRSMSEVKEVSVYTQLGGGWQIDVVVRKPIARIFNKFHETFYLDEDGVVMKASELHTARVVVVTGDVNDRLTSPPVSEIINNDSLISIRKLDDVYRISSYVCNDPLLQSLIGQIHLKENGDFVLIPLIGNQKIVFGTAYSEEEVREKFKKLKIFYKEGIPYEGWNKYSEISLKYNKQIVCKTVEGYTEEKE